MGLFNFFRKRNDSEISRRLDNERELLKLKKYQANKKKQLQMIPATLEELRKVGITSNQKLQLEYFFYCYSEKKAEELISALKNDFKYNIAPTKKIQNVFIVNGWTIKIKMEIENIENWITKMCDLSLKYDCEFNGWGTIPDQHNIIGLN